ncbi:Prolamin-like domain containing protein [Parasponia andersonii]|uniref:Prolamin-like domain containing protein n=1 Tax=Parasponia andersonii TaxID=3476 RepID=A0A2P5DKR4_PARAD|nr:Prolamin-like domain containing protein [Parasponia andersonii]
MNSLPSLMLALLLGFLCLGPYKGESCGSNQFLRYQRCTAEIQNHIFQRRPISSSCCSAILEAASADCLTIIPTNWFQQGQQFCLRTPSAPPTPSFRPNYPPPFTPFTPRPPLPPLTPFPPSPNLRGCSDTHRLDSCYNEMLRRYHGSCRITANCCTTILDVAETCRTSQISDFLRNSIDACKNQEY